MMTKKHTMRSFAGVTIMTVTLLISSIMVMAKGNYVFNCKDENGQPLSGVAVQLCSGSSCTMLKSDDNGEIVFDVAPGTYEVTVYKIPAGYELEGEAEFEISGASFEEELTFITEKDDQIPESFQSETGESDSKDMSLWAWLWYILGRKNPA